MSADNIQCVLLADRHHGLTERIRGLLETMFDAVVMVADEPSLQESQFSSGRTIADYAKNIWHIEPCRVE